LFKEGFVSFVAFLEIMSSSSTSRPSSPFSEDEVDSAASSCLIECNFNNLPTELRLKIWSCAVEPRVIILDDLMNKQQSYPLPSVAQINSESRIESRGGYEAVTQGSHVHFARDILVCDATISDKTGDSALEAVAEKLQRVALWDCFPDDKRIETPYTYSSYLSACYTPNQDSRPVVCEKLWFPNLKELWIVKVGHVDKSWQVDGGERACFDTRLKKTARTFRYWVDEGVVEMAPLSIDDPDTKLVLQHGRCGNGNCRNLNYGRAVMVSKVVFIDGEHPKGDSPGWKRVLPYTPTQGKTEEASKEIRQNEMRWIVVERALTFSLRWDWPSDSDEACRRRRGHLLAVTG
jgi:hypothetical protein